MRRMIIASSRPWGGSSWMDEVIRQRVEWLSSIGGGLLVTPMGESGPCLLNGIRHHEIPVVRASGNQSLLAQDVSDMVRNLVSGPGQWLVHAFGLDVAMGALLVRRGKAKLILEPNVSTVQIVRDRIESNLGSDAKGASAVGRESQVTAQLEELALSKSGRSAVLTWSLRAVRSRGRALPVGAFRRIGY